MLASRINAWESSPRPLPRAIVRAVRTLGHVRRFLLDPRRRSEQWTRLRYGRAHMQRATYSAPDRYPELFAACRDHLSNVPAPVVVSYGCSTGEEAFTLATYLPHATIVGADINRWCLKQCRRENRNPAISFVHSLSREFAALAGVDAIFCMAVFQRWENRNRSAHVADERFPFARFEEEIKHLDRMLRPGGLFFIDHADFRLEDTAVVSHYRRLECPGSQVWQDRPVFGRDNRLIALGYTAQRAFIKQDR